MKFMIFLAVSIFSLSANASMTCTAKTPEGAEVRILVNENSAVVDSDLADKKLEFTSIQSTWDGHGSGIIIGFLKGTVNDRALAIKYDNHFGIIKNVVVMTDIRAKANDTGQNDVLTANCLDSF